MLNLRLFTLFSVVAVLLLLLNFARRSDPTYSAEELNAIIQDREKDVVHVRKVLLNQQELAKPYIDSSTLRLANWNFNGHYTVQEDFVRLVQDKPQQAGSIFSKMPIQAESFEMELTFHIHSKNGGKIVGDGMAIWFRDAPSPIGDVFGAQNFFKGLGIFVDTYRNGGIGLFPQVIAMAGDGHTAYNKGDDGFTTKLANCKASRVVNNPSGIVRMRIIHLKNGYLSVDINYNPERQDKWRNCFTLSNVHLPVVKYLGFSAETGDLSHAVDLIENKMYALYHPEKNDFIGSIEELETMIKAQFAGNDKLLPKRKRKSIQRLRAAEKRIKEKDRARRAELYGDPDATFVRRTIRRILSFIKFVIITAVVLLLVYIAWNVYRTSRRRKGKAGLLD